MARLCDHLKGGGDEEGGDVGVGHDEGALLGGALLAGGVGDEGDRPCEEEAHLVRVRVRVRVRDRVRVRVTNTLTLPLPLPLTLTRKNTSAVRWKDHTYSMRDVQLCPAHASAARAMRCEKKPVASSCMMRMVGAPGEVRLRVRVRVRG